MGNMRRILILCLFAIINVSNIQGARVVRAGQATSQDVALLRAITSKEALPWILFATAESTELQTMFGLTEAVIDDGRLVSGTTFFTIPPAPQIFLCPFVHPQSNTACLVPKQFGTLQKLECEIEPMPILKPYPVEFHCGGHYTGVLLMFTYEVCSLQSLHRFNAQYSRIYTFCYDSDTKKNLFVSYSIIGAALLSEDLLIREREIEFAMNTKSYELIDENYYSNLQAEIQRYPKYGLQQLVPTEDMPLAASRKATRYYANFALQHNDLIGPWNDIRNHIRNHAITYHDQVLAFMTGVFDIPNNEISSAIGKNQRATIWVTQMTTMIGNRKKGLAIVMNNFIAEAFSKKGKPRRSSQRQYIDKLCDNQNICARSLKLMFENIGGEVRCCPLTQEITNLFFDTFPISQSLEVLTVDNITESSQ